MAVAVAGLSDCVGPGPDVSVVGPSGVRSRCLCGGLCGFESSACLSVCLSDCHTIRPSEAATANPAAVRPAQITHGRFTQRATTRGPGASRAPNPSHAGRSLAGGGRDTRPALNVYVAAPSAPAGPRLLAALVVALFFAAISATIASPTLAPAAVAATAFSASSIASASMSVVMSASPHQLLTEKCSDGRRSDEYKCSKHYTPSYDVREPTCRRLLRTPRSR